MTNEWMQTGETENVLQIWTKEQIIEYIRYLKMEYRNVTVSE